MSVESISIALHHSKARGTAKLILIGIANHDGDGGAWPKVETLAKYAGVSVRNAQKAIRTLEGLDEIEVNYRQGGTHKMKADKRPNLYRFILACPQSCDGSKNHRMHEVSNATLRLPSAVTPRGVSDTTAEPEVINHQKEPRRNKPAAQGGGKESDQASRDRFSFEEQLRQFGVTVPAGVSCLPPKAIVHIHINHLDQGQAQHTIEEFAARIERKGVPDDPESYLAGLCKRAASGQLNWSAAAEKIHELQKQHRH